MSKYARSCPKQLMDRILNLIGRKFCRTLMKQGCDESVANHSTSKKLIDAMNTRFCLLLSKANIDLAHNVPLQIQMYKKAINLNIYRQIILNGTVPATLNAYML